LSGPGSRPFSLHPLAALAGLLAQARLCARLLADGRVPVGPKLLVVAALLYLIAPFDLVPDLALPLLGEIDDIVVLWLAARALVRLAPADVVAEHRPGTARRTR
jgi:uncharacterized membrane protein YkvA (DUF1232 family)